VEELKKGKRGKLEGVEEKQKDKEKERSERQGRNGNETRRKSMGTQEMEEEMPVEWHEWVANRLSQILVEQSQLGKELVEVR
jgi:hypothetical protein